MQFYKKAPEIVLQFTPLIAVLKTIHFFILKITVKNIEMFHT